MRPHQARATIVAGIAVAAFAVTAGSAQADETADTTTETTTASVVSTTETSTPVGAGEGVACSLQASEVSGPSSSFTVGPEGCEGEIGPLSFSTFSLPGGIRAPYADQVLIAHAEGNGQSYGAGSYTLTATLGGACNWHSDLYYGINEMPPFSGLIAYDYSEGNECGGPIPVDSEDCVLLAADVERDTATFTVGPQGCEGEVGPISFSAFFLPGGMREPYEDQELIAHHESNGAFYPSGNHELTIDMGTPCNWQTDLYYGVNLTPKFRFLIAYDFDEREVCAEETTTTTTTVDQSGGGTTTTTPTTTSTTTSTTTTTVVDDGRGATTTSTSVADAGGETTTTSVVSAGPVPSATDGDTLPATGPSDTAVLTLLGGLLVGAGVLTRRLARR